MLDFTSALYLGMEHSITSLRPWDQFTTGRPAALKTPVRNRRVAAALAELVGCERAVLGPSTFHLFWDLFHVLAEDRVAVFIDAAAYPIARWGAEGAAARGSPVRFFSHHEPAALREQMVHSTRRPVVVTDGFCPGCGKPAPISDYLTIVHDSDGLLLLDDTQALGILGYGPDRANPYGSGGGGSLWFHSVVSPKIVVISSLAKGFGTPMAVLAGSRDLVSRFRSKGKTQMYCSPSSAADISAAEHALVFNATHGDVLRRRLANLVRYLRHQIGSISVATTGGLFPVQTLQPLPILGGQALHTRLQNLGVRTVLHSDRQDRRTRISFLINARHSHLDIENAVEVLRIIIVDIGFREKEKRLNYAF